MQVPTNADFRPLPDFDTVLHGRLVPGPRRTGTDFMLHAFIVPSPAVVLVIAYKRIVVADAGAMVAAVHAAKYSIAFFVK